MATEEEEEVHNPQLKFSCPPWFRGDPEERRCLGYICWHHEDICEAVEYNMSLLRRQSVSQTAEEVEKEEEEMRQKNLSESIVRDRKIIALAEKKQEEKEKKMVKYKRKWWSERWSERLLERRLKQAEDCRRRLASIDSSLKGIHRDIAYGLIKVWTFEMGKPYEISDLLSGRKKTRSKRSYLINNKGVEVNLINVIY